jgi:hypothetical protein
MILIKFLYFLLITSLFLSCHSSPPAVPYSVQVSSKSRVIELRDEQSQQVKAEAMDFLLSSSFISSEKGIDFDMSQEKAKYQETLKMDHIKITFEQSTKLNFNGKTIQFKELIIGPIEYPIVGAPYLVTADNQVIAFAKYSGALSIKLKNTIDSLIHQKN